MSIRLRRLTACINMLAIAFCLSFATTTVKAQPAVPGYIYIGTYNTHFYYISEYPVNGAVIASSIAGTQTILNAWPGIPSNLVYAATVSDKAENDAIQNFVLAFNENFYGAGNGLAPGGSFNDPRNVWIGLTDDPASASGATEGNFRWTNGEPVCYTNWNVCEPDNLVDIVDQDFVQMLIMQNYAYTLPQGSTCTQQPGSTINPLGKWNDYFNLPNNSGTHMLRIVLEIGEAPTVCPTPPCSLTVSASVAALSCEGSNVLYLGYGPQSVTATSNQTGTTFQWFNTENATAVATGATFTPTEPGTYYAVATNGQCTASTLGVATQITVKDVRCYNPGKDQPRKIYVCHKGKGINGNGETAEALCVDASAVPAHLAHGDCLGQCPPATQQGFKQTGLQPETKAFDNKLAVSGYPNPSGNGFRIKIDGPTTEKATIRVTDVAGRLVEQRNNVLPNQVIQIGGSYRAGMYFIEVVQGNNKRQLKLVKH